MESPICSYLHTRGILVELNKSFSVLRESLSHMWRFFICLKMMLFWFEGFYLVLHSALDAENKSPVT